jgi:hypothetical protein
MHLHCRLCWRNHLSGKPRMQPVHCEHLLPRSSSQLHCCVPQHYLFLCWRLFVLPVHLSSQLLCQKRSVCVQRWNLQGHEPRLSSERLAVRRLSAWKRLQERGPVVVSSWILLLSPVDFACDLPCRCLLSTVGLGSRALSSRYLQRLRWRHHRGRRVYSLWKWLLLHCPGFHPMFCLPDPQQHHHSECQLRLQLRL